MKKFVMVLIALAIGSGLAFGTLAYKREDTTGCNVPDNPLAGATFCQGYGPSQLYGWPKALKETPDSAMSDDELVEIYKDNNREALIFNLLVFNAITLSGVVIYLLVKKR